MGKDSNEIRREIEATRARMGDTVEALGYKADVPSRVKDAVSERVETVKGTIGDAVAGVKDAVGGVTGKVGSALGGATSSVTNTFSETSGRVGDVTGTMAERVNGVTSTLSDKLPSGEDVKNVARRGAGIAAENPLGLALGALAVGFLAGLAAPVTQVERETVGPIRDELLEKAQSIGSDVLEHGKQVLQETAQAAVQSAQQSVQSHGKDVLSEARGQSAHGGESATTEYGALLDDDTLEPGAPGTASP